MEVSTDKAALLNNNKNKTSNKKLIIALVILTILVIASVIVNIYQSGFLDNSKNEELTSENNLKDCINGEIYWDRNICECYSCYSGDKCEIDNTETCTISSGSGQPHLFMEYWNSVADKVNSLSLKINYRGPYQSNFVGPFSESSTSGLGGMLNQKIRAVHEKYHNINTTGKYLVFGVGASQLTTGLYTAWGKLKNKQIKAFARTPYYYLFPTRCSAATEMYCLWNTSYSQNSDDVVEFITIPNNPDGMEYQPYYNNSAQQAYDLVYYWPHFYESKEILIPKNVATAFFSFTKFTGHAASRFGWIFVDNYNLANQIRSYISASVLALPVETHIRAHQIFEYILENGDEYFDFIRNRMQQRWELFNSLFINQTNYIQKARVGHQYAWVQCVGKNSSQIQSVFSSFRIRPYYGSSFGQSDHVRFNLAEYEGVFQAYVKKFKALIDAER